jgi:hypothetical protein
VVQTPGLVNAGAQYADVDGPGGRSIAPPLMLDAQDRPVIITAVPVGTVQAPAAASRKYRSVPRARSAERSCSAAGARLRVRRGQRSLLARRADTGAALAAA